ncbi:MAG: SDR family NAD(P)-dependent oxidoreductase, partial [Blastocatellia bacterium]
MELAGRVALVTGGARGIGRATVLQLARSGVAGVAINYRSLTEDVERLAEEVRQIGTDAICVPADVQVDEQVRAMVERVGQHFGRLDILINNAGITSWVPYADLES